MKILYIASEHVSGTLSLFKREHERRGDYCRFVTFWHSHWDFPDDICLNLPLMPDRAWVRSVRKAFLALRSSQSNGKEGIPFWNPGKIERLLFRLRDNHLWPRIEKVIREYNLDSYDIVHLDGGLDFTRDARFVRRLHEQGKHIACFYHGSDFRTRGVLRAVDELTDLSMTSEWDLLEFDKRLRYLYLPFDTSLFPLRSYKFHHPIRIGHAARNPFKGTAYVEAAVARLAAQYPVELVLMRNLPHSEAIRRKFDCDIFVDQLTNTGGWGYGMSSVEALAMGMPVVTNIPPQMEKRIGEHPFVNADTVNLYEMLQLLINNEDRCRLIAEHSREWVTKFHDATAVADQLYAHYSDLGWMS